MSKRVREKENEKKKDKKIKAEFKTFVLRILLPHWKKKWSCFTINYYYEVIYYYKQIEENHSLVITY